MTLPPHARYSQLQSNSSSAQKHLDIKHHPCKGPILMDLVLELELVLELVLVLVLELVLVVLDPSDQNQKIVWQFFVQRLVLYLAD